MSTTFPVSVSGSKQRSVTHLGCAEGASWSLRPILNVIDLRCLGVDIIRSTKIGVMKIDVDLSYLEKRLLLSAIDFSQGQETMRFLFNETIIHARPLISSDFSLRGYVTVHDSSKHITDESEASNFAHSSSKGESPTLQQLSDDFLSLWNNPDSFSDAILKCGNAEMPVHKGILSARSPVFDAMFRNKMREGAEGLVNITDIELDVLQAMLKYMYSGRTDHLTDSMAGDMLFAADKYQLQELKSFCVDRLKSSLKVDNCFGVLVLGHLHDEDLKEAALEFICKWKKFSELEKTEEWKIFVAAHPSLAIEVLTSTVKYVQDLPPTRVGDK